MIWVKILNNYNSLRNILLLSINKYLYLFLDDYGQANARAIKSEYTSNVSDTSDTDIKTRQKKNQKKETIIMK